MEEAGRTWERSGGRDQGGAWAGPACVSKWPLHGDPSVGWGEQSASWGKCKVPARRFNSSCDHATPMGWSSTWQELWGLVPTAPSRCQDACTRVCSSSFVFHVPVFLMPSRCLTWMPVTKWGSSSGSRETKAKVAIVTEATEHSSSSSPESLSRGQAMETGPGSDAAGRALLGHSAAWPSIELWAGFRKVTQALGTGMEERQSRLDPSSLDIFLRVYSTSLRSYQSFLSPSVPVRIKHPWALWEASPSQHCSWGHITGFSAGPQPQWLPTALRHSAVPTIGKSDFFEIFIMFWSILTDQGICKKVMCDSKWLEDVLIGLKFPRENLTSSLLLLTFPGI